MKVWYSVRGKDKNNNTIVCGSWSKEITTEKYYAEGGTFENAITNKEEFHDYGSKEN